MARISVIGAGAWGSALACVCARNEHETILWSRSSEQVREISDNRTNHRYLGDLRLDANIIPTTDITHALKNADIILLSIPAQNLASVLGSFPAVTEQAILVTTCKGIDRETGKLPSSTVKHFFPNNPIAALSGPSFAHDVVKSLPTAVTIAANEITTAQMAADELSSSMFRCYSSEDLPGAELGGALKNVLALAVGAARGMALGASAEAALIARGFAEITRLATALGARRETLMGLSGLGDITLTCSTPQSRNFSFGIALGKGDDLQGLKLAEGAFTAGVAKRLADEHQIDVPITSAIVNVLEKRVTAREAVEQLLTRPLKRES
ncbi:MAG: NAD(P)H-dependent glycerol-3-phosphate dehydrogenase [Rhizobiaceae bacterium]|nr:NAD(P)H-dependent glycerol-3-phosphate dehydrogenase [Rhizobiaceae bacterium]